ncbi:MAG: glutamate-1-semialdehyde 2,1-aminomutase [Acidimicrobiia bacterium]|nr:glutamate-1-semialdehyde 2,1-aminomutase [Acidimicrobiia bacterium]
MTDHLAVTRAAAERLAALVPGGAHTYAKGPDQYPVTAPGVLRSGRGCRVWDLDDNEYIEYGMGLRSVGLGHAHPEVVEAVRRSLELGTNFTRPAVVELECAERLLSLVPGADMVKFTKDGSSATTAAVKLARAHTGRDLVGICVDHPFFSYDDWFIGTTTMDGGIPPAASELTIGFNYNDLPSVRDMFDRFPDRIAVVMLEGVRAEAPEQGFLEGLRELCTRHGTVLVFDEMIAGFRYDIAGAQGLYEVRPDLSTWGKALANGFSVSALCGSRDLMRLGSRERDGDDVFLLSTTHGAEVCALAAAIATMEIYQREPVVEHLHRQGARLADGLRKVAARHGVGDHVSPLGFPCNLVFTAADREGNPSQAFRTLLLQELVDRGVLAPSLVVSYSHGDADIDRTLDAFDGALAVYARALDGGIDQFLRGRPSRVVMDHRPIGVHAALGGSIEPERRAGDR